MQFCARGLSRPHFVIRMGTFNHCGRSKAWNSTHHGRYVFQAVFFVEKYEHQHVHIHVHIRLHVHVQTHVYVHVRVHMHVRVRVCLCVFFGCVCRVMSCAARWLVGWLGGVVLSTCLLSWWSLSLVLPASYDEYIATGKSVAFND